MHVVKKNVGTKLNAEKLRQNFSSTNKVQE